MEPITGHWLDPAGGPIEPTPELGVRLEGRGETRPNSKPARCPNCGGELALLATYENSRLIRFSKFGLASLELCPACSAETDGAAGGNGFYARLRAAGDAMSEPALAEPVYFHATPTEEPSSEQEFRRWRPCVKAKLGGRQLSIQPRLEANCERCFGPLMFLASIDEAWAPGVLNFAGGLGYLFVCQAECSPESTLFYWDCD